MIQLSAMDQLCAHVYPCPTYFWRLQPGDNPLTHFEHLRAGLSRVLYLQPHLAGVHRINQRGAYSIEIPPAPYAGTRFIYRDLSNDDTSPSFDELEAAGFPLADGNLDGLAKFRPDPYPTCEDGDPIIIQQLTHLRGGLVLTTSYSHMVGDLVQGISLGRTWAAMTQAIAEAARAGKPEPPLPEPLPANLMDRSPLIPKNSDPLSMEELTKMVEIVAPESVALDPSNPEKMLKLFTEMFPPAYISEKDKSIEDELRTTRAGIWHFTPRSLAMIKQDALSASPPGEKFTSIDALSAFLWQRFIVAKYQPGSEEEAPNSNLGGNETAQASRHIPSVSQVVFAGDARRRPAVPLPQTYLGVCVDLFRVKLPMKEVLPLTSSEPMKSGLAKASIGLRHTNGQWSESRWRRKLELSWRAPVSPGLVPKGPIDLLMTDHTRGKVVTTMDWGPGLGPTLAIREPYFGRTCPLGEITLLPRADGGVEAVISGETVTMLRLLADGEMKRVSRNVFLMPTEIEDLKTRRLRRARL